MEAQFGGWEDLLTKAVHTYLNTIQVIILLMSAKRMVF